MAKRLNMSQPGVSYAVKKGERIVSDKNVQMIVPELQMDVPQSPLNSLKG